MIWPTMLFNLCVGLLFAAFLLRAVRRYERRADTIMVKLDRDHEESMRKYGSARDEIRTSMRLKMDQAVAEMRAKTEHRPELNRHAEELQTGDPPQIYSGPTDFTSGPHNSQKSGR